MSASCARSVPWSRLVDYWIGELDEPSTHRLEVHMFDCEPCTLRLWRLRELGVGIADWARRRMRGGTSPELLARFAEDRLAVHDYRAEPGGEIHCSAWPEDDLVVLRLAADLVGVERADLEMTSSHSGEVVRAEDLPIIGGREVCFAERAEALRLLPAHDTAVRLLAVGPGGERELARYTLHHAPYQPGMSK